MSKKRNYQNDSEVRTQLEKLLSTRKLYAAASQEKDLLARQATAELKALDRLIVGKSK